MYSAPKNPHEVISSTFEHLHAHVASIYGTFSGTKEKLLNNRKELTLTQLVWGTNMVIMTSCKTL